MALHRLNRCIALTDVARLNGIHVLAGRGSGKSRLLGRLLAYQDLCRGVPLVVFDVVGASINNLLDRLARQPETAQRSFFSRIRYVDMAAPSGYVVPWPLYYRLHPDEPLFRISQRYLDSIKRLDPHLVKASVQGWNALWLIGTMIGTVLAALDYQITEVASLLDVPDTWAARLDEALNRYPVEMQDSHRFFREEYRKWPPERRATYTGAPTCQRAIPIMGFSVGRTVAEIIHDFGHRAEATFSYIYKGWEPLTFRTRFDRLTFIVKYPEIRHKTSIFSGYSGCGLIHFAPNSVTEGQRDNKNFQVLSYCDAMYANPDLTGTVTADAINCEVWGCTQFGFISYWFKHFPSYDGVGTDGLSQDWWQYVIDPNKTLADADKLDQSKFGPDPTFRVVAAPAKKSVLEIFAAGRPAVDPAKPDEDPYPAMRILLDNQPVATFRGVQGDFATRQTNGYVATFSSVVTIDHLKIEFFNDYRARDLFIDKISLDDKVYETESPKTMTTTLSIKGKGCTGELLAGKTEYLLCNGYVAYHD